jgi:hypothetical protein
MDVTIVNVVMQIFCNVYSILVLASGFRELNINANVLTANSNALPIFERAFIMLAFISFLGVLVASTIYNMRILEIVGKKK